MHPIPVDDYQTPYNPRHLRHDIWSIDTKNKTMQMKLSTCGDLPGQTTDVLNALANGRDLVGKWECGQWTFLVFHIGGRMSLYHAVCGRYEDIPRSPSTSVYARCKNYTGEFIRALRRVPEYKIPMGRPWLHVRSIEPILGRKCPMLLTIESLGHRWGITTRETHCRLFRDYPSIPSTGCIAHRDMTGYDVLRQYGYLDDK